MPWSIKTPLFYLFSPNKTLLFSAHAPTVLNKMGVLNANIVTFLTQYVPFFFLPHALRNFGVKQLLHLYVPSIVFLPLFFRTSLHSKDYMNFFLSLSPLLIMSLFNLYLLLQTRTSRPSLMIVMNLLQTPLFAVLLGPIDCKWIYKIKTHYDGTIEHYKACLVAKGYSQEYGIDYEETFAPVARMTYVRSLLAIVVTKQWPLLQMDVKNAFLNGTLSEEVYMKPPPGTSPPLHKAISDL
ncbi:Integrase, catalytic core [Cucumis melo var. makuwa]|uniref:Integrase, catalytic core n=1 Tax=Cucumis melo var. makuwa TaxID=1194695 RepID=A0A5A7UVI6_CUCMM|nr:Integrase, catalytic core [Cucumis melo var. makuwa]TYJ97242.1 Integrase, catalytic core [Cucumis melo var. makuwa]